MDGHIRAHTSRRVEAQDRAYRVSEIAELFGMSERHVWRLIRRGDLKAERLSVRCIRIFESEISRYRENLRDQSAA